MFGFVRHKTSIIILVLLLVACAFVSADDQFKLVHIIGSAVQDPWMEVWEPGTTTAIDSDVAVPVSNNAYHFADIGLHYYGVRNMNIYLAYTPLYLVVDSVRQTTPGGDPIIYPYTMQINRIATTPDHDISYTDDVYDNENVTIATLWEAYDVGSDDGLEEATIAELSVLLGDDRYSPAGTYESLIYLIWEVN